MPKRNLRWIVLGLVTVGCGLLAAWGWTPDSHANPGCKLIQNAAWISVDWLSQPVDVGAVAQLAASARRRHLSYLFPYTTYIRADRSFNPTYAHAQEFVRTFRRLAPEVRLLAWIGIPLTSRYPGGIPGWVDLSQPETRQALARSLAEVAPQAEFDGVQIDAETVHGNDANFLLFLEDIRRSMGPDKVLSVAGSHWAPDWVDALPFARDLSWSSAYYQAVGRRANQVAVMSYDSYAPQPAMYRLWMREQVRGVSQSLEGSAVELLIGVSVSRDATLSHQPSAENLAGGLAGICAGALSPRPVQGVAIYADWDFSTADEQLWQQWQSEPTPASRP